MRNTGNLLRTVAVPFLLILLVSPAVAYRLPDSGQSKCYQGPPPVETSCEGTGQDGAYARPPLNYTVHDDGTVTDGNTGLIWQRETPATAYNWYRATGTPHVTHNPEGTNVCGELELAEATDWRLPAWDELAGIVDFGVPPPGPAIDAAAFPGTVAAPYWTSTAWNVNFSSGLTTGLLVLDVAYRVRCVRGAPPPAPAFVDNDNGTVTDPRTGLTWQQGQPGTMNWAAALAYCEGLELAGSTSWRLPSIREHASLVDATKQSPAIDTALFPNAASSDYWSSTTNPQSGSAWGIMFSEGWIINAAKHLSFRPRCVTSPEYGALEARDDASTIPEDGSARVLVTLNDRGEGTIAVTAVGAAGHGTTSRDSHRVTYTPDADWSGEDSFTYDIADGSGGASTATVTVTALPVDDPPVAADDTAATDRDTPVTIPVLANDGDGDGDAVVLLSVEAAVHGTTEIDGDVVTYTPGSGFLGTDHFSYTIGDGRGGEDSATVTVSVVGTLRFTSVGAQDGWIRESAEKSGKGGTLNARGTTLRIGDHREDRQYRALLSFDTKGLPDNAIVTAATLAIKVQGLVGSDPFVTHGALVGDVKRGAFSGSASLGLGDFKAAAGVSNGLGGFVALAEGWYAAEFGPASRALVNQRGPTQVRLRFTLDDNDDRGDDWVFCASGNAAAELRPVLEVRYTLPADPP